MASLQLTKVLESTTGVKKDGAIYHIPEELDVNAFIALGQEILQIPRLQRVEVGADHLVLLTHKNERFYFPPDQVVGLRIGGPEAKARNSGAGFVKSGPVL
jgi:hypothetical protein